MLDPTSPKLLQPLPQVRRPVRLPLHQWTYNGYRMTSRANDQHTDAWNVPSPPRTRAEWLDPAPPPAVPTRIIWVGRNAKDPLLKAADDYASRVSLSSRGGGSQGSNNKGVEVVMVRDRGGDLVAEGREILKAAGADGDFLVCLDERGELLSTAAFRHRWDQWADFSGTKRVCFVVGGADGLPPAVREKAGATIALGPMTMPHRLALVVLLEQIYRVQQIRAGTGYHRE